MNDPRTVELLRRIGGRVRQLRHKKGLTAKKLAERSELSVRFISQLEGGRANIAVGRLDRIAAALDTCIGDLVEDPKRPSRNSTPIALLGLRGAGKSAIGPLLADRLGLDFIELDERIQAEAGLDLAEIFALHGEPYYRRLEGQCLARVLASAEPCVVELPGGIVQNEEAFRLADREAFTIWLKAKPEDHMSRVVNQGDYRPMANRDNAMAELRALLSARTPFYRQARVTLDTSESDVLEVVRRALFELKKAGWEADSTL